MMRQPTLADRTTTMASALLWIWTVVVSLGTGILLARYFGTWEALDFGWFFWGALIGLFSTLPFWALYALGGQVLRNVLKLRDDLAAGTTPASTPTK